MANQPQHIQVKSLMGESSDLPASARTHENTHWRSDYISEQPGIRTPETVGNGVLSPAGSAVMAMRAVLLVEDDAMIALDAEDMLKSIGFDKVVTVSKVSDAHRAIAENEFAFALLDINLGDELSTAIAEDLLVLGVRFAFVSGYGDSSSLPEKFRDKTVLAKPYTEETLRVAVQISRN